MSDVQRSVSGRRHVLFVLENGEPSEWALAKNLEPGEDARVYLYRFEGLTDEMVENIEEYGGPAGIWDELQDLPHTELSSTAVTEHS